MTPSGARNGRTGATERRRERLARGLRRRELGRPEAAISAAELAEHSARRTSIEPLPPHELARWLLASQLATVGSDGLLRPTAFGVELGAGLA